MSRTSSTHESNRGQRPAVAPPIRTKTAGKLRENKVESHTSVKGSAKSTSDDLWRKYASVRNAPGKDAEREEIRNQLIVKFHHLVRYTAERMRTRLPAEVEVDDLISAGLFGLMDAIDAFDTSRGIKFETYCPQRVRGAIFDELRAMDWVPRLVRSRTTKVERVRKEIEMKNGRPATDPEIRDRLGVSADEFEKISRDSRPVGVVSLNKKWADPDAANESREIDVAQPDGEGDPFKLLQRQDLQTLLTKGLTRAERLIVILYYYEELTMKEIGLTLDLSESRVSQMHSSILARLKSQMKHRLKEIEQA
ncbi:MAG: FliA/WhiG family RNA polymerase sigma factor [Phycisphaerales bacterium]|nr:FliA/WhiG family RNA polymerase sigma factor [Phycisphaerales bacterium]